MSVGGPIVLSRASLDGDRVRVRSRGGARRGGDPRAAAQPRPAPRRPRPRPTARGPAANLTHHASGLDGRTGPDGVGPGSGLGPGRARPAPLGRRRSVRGLHRMGRAGSGACFGRERAGRASQAGTTPGGQAGRLHRPASPSNPPGSVADRDGRGRGDVDAVRPAGERGPAVGIGGLGRLAVRRTGVVRYPEPTVIEPVIWVGCTSQWKKYVPGPGKVTW